MPEVKEGAIEMQPRCEEHRSRDCISSSNPIRVSLLGSMRSIALCSSALARIRVWERYTNGNGYVTISVGDQRFTVTQSTFRDRLPKAAETLLH